MARKIIDIGIVGNDGTGDSIRDSFRKVNDNFRELYSSLGLGENLLFINLDDTPTTYLSQENALLTVNNTETGIAFKQLVPGIGVSIDFQTNQNEIRISSEFSAVSGDPAPQLGGPMSAWSGDTRFTIGGLVDVSNSGEFQNAVADLTATFGTANDVNNPNRVVVNKGYADTKISRAGVNAIDPADGQVNPLFGTMTGPLILSRDPEPDDDEIYDGLVAATKRYVDNSAFGSSVNLYVATSGEDDRVGISRDLQGRALAYAYRTLEAALKKAEEIVRESEAEIGPYKKVLTYNNGVSQAILEDVAIAPNSGSGFEGVALLSVDQAAVASAETVGANYQINDILTVVGSGIENCRLQVLSTTEAGGVSTFRILSTGVYLGTSLPGTIVSGQRRVSVTATRSDGATISNGVGAVFSVTFSVRNVQINQKGTGYGLVSVRVEGGGGTGAFGTADVVSEKIEGITINDPGTGFISNPDVIVNLPRFFIKTEFQRTDFTGDVETETQEAVRSRDIREGLYIRGEESGALAQILAHSGELDSDGNEIFDVDILYGKFITTTDRPAGGEAISYGDVAQQVQITILVESGIYEENFPLKIPANTSIVGDEFRRCIVRPKPGLSSSPWAFQHFRRDLEIGDVVGFRPRITDEETDLETLVPTVDDRLTIADRLFGWHYLQDSSRPVYLTGSPGSQTIINNKGFYRSAAKLLEINRSFIQNQVVEWIDDQIANGIDPFDPGFLYNRNICQRDVGLIIDALVFDLRYGGSDRSISAALKYKGNASGLFAIDPSGQLSETVAGIRRINTLAQLVIKNIPITEIYGPGIIPQIVDGAYVAETGSVGSNINISNITNANPIVITTSIAHGLVNGDEILISNVGGMTEINGNNYYVEVINSTSFSISEFSDRSELIDGLLLSTYTSGGVITEPQGVVGALINGIIDVIENSDSVNYPKDNDQMDMFLCNDSVRLQAITGQGHGGFMMVLDPEGQILAKSPYAQECASFSKSTGRQTFAGGMFIDGFAGNLQFEILEKVIDPGTGLPSDTILRVGRLKRLPQLPASFIVNDTVYRINYVRDYQFNVNGSTAIFVLDETTPWPFDLFTYNDDICFRDVGLILDGLGLEIVLGTNYHQRKAGLSYRQANAEVVIDDQSDLTVRAIEYAHDLANDLLTSYSSAQAVVQASNDTIIDIIRNGAVFAPTLVMSNPPGLSTNLANAKTLLLANINFIGDETIGWIAAQVAGPTPPFSGSFSYDSVRCKRDIGYIIEAVAYDLIYGGNSETSLAGLAYYNGVGDAITLQLAAGQEQETAAALAYARDLAKRVVQNLAPVSTYSSTPRVTGTPATVSEANIINTLMVNIEDIVTGGVGAADPIVAVNLSSYSYNTSALAARSILVAEKTDIQTATIEFVDENANVYEVLMPGNRSMLGNDYTQINDLGYGIIVTNGGLCEAVSMFTYYCHISFYSVNGGQIRSVSSSSAHGNYALVAQGADPLEVPTPVTLYYDLSQGATVYNDGASYSNAFEGLEIYIDVYEYIPLLSSELEIDHGLGSIYRYPITSVTLINDPAVPNLARIGLGVSEGAGIDGLAAAVADNTRVTIRQNAQVVLTGDVANVATRPSTGLVLRESPTVYRVLQFEEYDDPVGQVTCTISIANPAVITKSNHGLQPGYQISFRTTGTLPTGIQVTTIDGVTISETYYILPDNFTSGSFQISAQKNGTPVTTSGSQSGVQSYIVEGLARTTLRENYNYVDVTVWPSQPYQTSASTCTISVANPAVITRASHGFTANTVIKFSVSTGGVLPTGISVDRHYFVHTVLGINTFTIKATVAGSQVQTTGAGSGTFSVGKVTGAIGDSIIAVVPPGDEEEVRIVGTKFNFRGDTYTIIDYENELDTGQAFGRITIDPALIRSVVYYDNPPTLKGGVPKAEPGNLRIRISLTRVTGHDLLEIGTGSYADTNYPSEIFGPPVNPFDPAKETQERSVGRVFYVTTDQFGNFRVGPYFSVDQGTGSVTFAASIALSNLDGIGFKRGVPVSEFSTDSSFSDNATDTVPTENATRSYIEKRLGTSHSGAVIPAAQQIPSLTGGFMALSGVLSMKADLNMGASVTNKIINLADPITPTDAVNLRSLTLSNFQNWAGSNVQAGQFIVFNGVGNTIINAGITGDLTFDLRTGVDSTLNNIDVQINPGVISNAEVNASAAIAQSKLNLNAATTRANATGITQADRGLASFDSAVFDVTSGWVTIKNNGITLADLPQVAADSVLGNSGATTANVAEVTFTTIVNEGLAIKKSNYTGLGFLRRKNSLSANGDTGTGISDSYEIIDADSSNTASTLVRRDVSGDFAGRNISVERLIVDSRTAIDTTTSGGGGVLQLYGYSGQAAILLGDGTLATDKKNYYDNNEHVFRTYPGGVQTPAKINCGEISATAITCSSITGNGSPSTVMTGTFTLATGSTLQATYADLAEYYEGDKEYSVGTVLVFGGEKEVTTTNKQEDHRVAGVVSDNAAYVMNQNCQGLKVLIALQGRVPCRVVGKISKGDLIITSQISGVAVSAGGNAKAGTIIGKALQDYDSDHIGTIEVAVGRA